MIIKEISMLKPTERSRLYSLFNASGKSHLFALLTAEKEIFSNCILQSVTVEGRKLELKAKSKTLTEEEKQILEATPREFLGVMKDGILRNEEEIAIVKDYLRHAPLLDKELEMLAEFDSSETNSVSETFFAKDLSVLNLHPQTFDELVYTYLFTSPDYAKNELLRLFNYKLKSMIKVKPVKVFASKAQAEKALLSFNLTSLEQKEFSELLNSLYVVGDLSAPTYLATLERCMQVFDKSSAAVDWRLYPNLKDVLPQYNTKKLQWFLITLQQFNQATNVTVSQRITIDSIYAFYRKAVELCYC